MFYYHYRGAAWMRASTTPGRRHSCLTQAWYLSVTGCPLWLTVNPIASMRFTTPAPACGPPSGRMTSVPAVGRTAPSSSTAARTAVRQEFVRRTHAQLALGDPEPRRDLCWGRHFRVGPALPVPCLPRAPSSADVVRPVALGGGSLGTARPVSGRPAVGARCLGSLRLL